MQTYRLQKIPTRFDGQYITIMEISYFPYYHNNIALTLYRIEHQILSIHMRPFPNNHSNAFLCSYYNNNLKPHWSVGYKMCINECIINTEKLTFTVSDNFTLFVIQPQ